MTTADRRHDADRPAGGHGDAHDAPATRDERHLGEGAGERSHAQRLDAQDADAHRAGEADASGAYPVDVDSDSSATTGRSADSSVDNPADHAAAAGDGTPAVSGTVAAVPTTTSSTIASTASSGTASGTSTGSGDLERLVPANRVDEYTSRWDAVKGEFVDEPRQAVAEADKLVGELLDELDQLFRKQRSDLEHGLDADEASTEDLRLALRKYRSFFDRLLAL